MRLSSLSRILRPIFSLRSSTVARISDSRDGGRRSMRSRWNFSEMGRMTH